MKEIVFFFSIQNSKVSYKTRNKVYLYFSDTKQWKFSNRCVQKECLLGATGPKRDLTVWTVCVLSMKYKRGHI